MKTLPALFALLTVAVSTAALAADADLLRCRTLADANAKLACYDAIAVAVNAVAVNTVAVNTVAAPAQAGARPAATAPAAATTPATATASEKDTTFGLTARQIRKPDESDGIASTLVGAFSGWTPDTTFRLANGQVWHVADDSEASLYERQAPKITIKRNFLGNFFLEVEGVNQAPRVRRVE